MTSILWEAVCYILQLNNLFCKTEGDALKDPIKIDTGFISGAVIGDVGKEVRIYRGIPYAAPPVGELHWKQ